MYSRTVRPQRRATRVSALVFVAAVAAGCSSSSKPAPAGAPASGTNAATSSAVLAAKAEFQTNLKTQSAPAVPLLPAKPPSDRSITIQTCPLPVCQTTTTAAREAALKLGWKVSYLQSDLTPQAYQTVVNQIVANPPQLLALTPVVPDSFISGQLATLKAHGTKVVEIAPGSNVPAAAGPVEGVVAGTADFAHRGRLMGDAVVADAGGAADTLYVWDPTLAANFTPERNALTTVIDGAGGAVAVLDVSQANIGKTIPTQVTSYLQSHPKVKYVAFAIADLAIGVPQALRSAGVPPVKILSTGPQASTMADLAHGDQWASVGQENAAAGYRAIDQLARLTMGLTLGPLADAPGWSQIYVKDNVTETNAPPAYAGFPQNYLTAWRVGS